MTQFDELYEYIREFPGATRKDFRRDKPKITHEHELISRMLSEGLIVRVKEPRGGRMTYAHYVTEARP